MPRIGFIRDQKNGSPGPRPNAGVSRAHHGTHITHACAWHVFRRRSERRYSPPLADLPTGTGSILISLIQLPSPRGPLVVVVQRAIGGCSVLLLITVRPGGSIARRGAIAQVSCAARATRGVGRAQRARLKQHKPISRSSQWPSRSPALWFPREPSISQKSPLTK